MGTSFISFSHLRMFISITLNICVCSFPVCLLYLKKERRVELLVLCNVIIKKIGLCYGKMTGSRKEASSHIWFC